MPDSPTPPFKSGFVAIVGKPNAGKSTLLNGLIGQKIAIVSDKPQTTRDRIAGVLSADNYQIVFIDTPGLLVPQDQFNEALMLRAAEALDDADVIYHIIDATDREPMNDRLRDALNRRGKAALFLLVNKMDRIKRSKPAGTPLPDIAAISALGDTRYDETFYISALRRNGLEPLIRKTVERLPEGPQYYDPEQLSDRDMRFFAAEIVREKVFRCTGDEIPYAVFAELETYEEREELDFIRVAIHVERDSQKGILIGQGGQRLKKIGQDARHDIERITGRPAYLELWVKVTPNWRKNERDLKEFGFARKTKSKRHRP